MAFDAKHIAGRVRVLRARNLQRDANYRKLVAIRNGDYESVAPGLFNTAEFDKPLVANLIDTTARDIAEVMAPLPGFTCQPTNKANDSDVKRADLRANIARGYVQNSRLQDQLFAGTDRYGSFGFMAYQVEPDFVEQMPVIRVVDNHSCYYTKDYRGRVVEFFEPYKVHPDQLCADFPEHAEKIKAALDPYGQGYLPDQKVEVVRWQDADHDALICLDPCLLLQSVPNRLGKTLVRVVERPNITSEGPRGQFDDVVWVQIARALVQMYTMNALERSVNAPVVLPKDVQELELGPFAAVQTDNPQGVGTVPLQIAPGLFPEQQILAQEQRTGSRYPEGRSGSIDASIITGQGVQALMGTFDTQVQTFQRLNASALTDVIALCFEMDETYWPDVKKTRRVKDNGQPRKFDYTPGKDIAGDYTVDVTYGAIAGLDPNRGLVFLLQALSGGLISDATARRHLPVDVNVVEEEQQINLEQMKKATMASLAAIPQALPMMVSQGMDPRDIALQMAEVTKRIQKGDDPVEAMQKVFAPKEQPKPGAPMVDPLAEAAAQAQGAPAGNQMGSAMGGGDDASNMLMLLAGMGQSGKADLSASVSRMIPT